MQLSPKLAGGFETLQNRYPFKRSALIPMMMYAQDEYGCVSDEMIAEIAKRLDLRTVQVEETLAYYSMLRRKPMGKHHVQICTNVACMLRGGNELLNQAKKALKEMTPESIIDEVKKSNLRGRGGAGFPTGMKWSFVPKDSPKAKYVICNADESEPGTCKDRPLMEMDPHQMIEGIIIAGRAIGAAKGFIYIRGEYRYVLDIVQTALDEAYSHNYLGNNILGSGVNFDLIVHTGAGAYECGEESALMESLEGKRGYPRIKPPFPAVLGLYGCPTIINNVETLSTVPAIILEGGEKYPSRGTPKNRGTRLLSVAGHANKPPVSEIPLGMNMKKSIYELAGGIPHGKKLKAGIPRGSSCPLLQPAELHPPMD